MTATSCQHRQCSAAASQRGFLPHKAEQTGGTDFPRAEFGVSWKLVASVPSHQKPLALQSPCSVGLQDSRSLEADPSSASENDNALESLAL